MAEGRLCDRWEFRGHALAAKVEDLRADRPPDDREARCEVEKVPRRFPVHVAAEQAVPLLKRLGRSNGAWTDDLAGKRDLTLVEVTFGKSHGRRRRRPLATASRRGCLAGSLDPRNVAETRGLLDNR